MKRTCRFCGDKNSKFVKCDSCKAEMCIQCEHVLSLDLKNGEKGCVECEH